MADPMHFYAAFGDARHAQGGGVPGSIRRQRHMGGKSFNQRLRCCRILLCGARVRQVLAHP